MTKPLILITNDDGLFAPGIKALIEVVKEIGTPIIVAPDSPQSGKGHAISIHEPLRLNKVTTFGADIEAYECSGTPVDCVKLARNVVLKGRVPALCVSGINHGSNVAINILYSGTMSAAMEASLEGIDSIGFSLLDFSFEADFGPSKPFVKKIIEYTLQNGLGGTKLLNVNIPNLPLNEIKGFKVCRQANAGWKEDFLENKDPLDRPYYWMSGEFVNNDTGADTDVKALEDGYISVVPCQHDLTAYKAITTLKNLEQVA